jgi:hypothetical protein
MYKQTVRFKHSEAVWPRCLTGMLDFNGLLNDAFKAHIKPNVVAE